MLFALITFYFLDFAHLLPESFGWLAKIQLVPALSALSVVILVAWVLLTLLFGRLYCSSVCPMGIWQDIISWLSGRVKGKKRRFTYSRPKTILRWTVVGVVFIAFFLGCPVLLALVDPYSAFGRMATGILKPIYLAGNNTLEWIFSHFNNYTFYRMEVIIHSLFALGVAIITFLVVGVLAWRYGRTWCNTLCPVGTLLGFLSKYALFKVRINTEACTQCGICAAKCKASCINSKEKTVDNSRCVDCFNCLSTCKRNAISYSPSLQREKAVQAEATPVELEEGTSAVDASRRQFLLTSLATAAAIPSAMAQNTQEAILPQKERWREHPIAPPGAVAYEHLLKHCTSCHLCISKCPSQVLKPALLEYGIGGIMQPMLYFDKGFCNYDCTVCGDVCPNDAIHSLTKEQKHHTQVGYVVFVPKRSIVITDGTSCGACSEHCPTQAVSMVPFKNGLTIPKIKRSICVGCGGCEFICPARPLRAIYVEGHPEQKEREAFDDGEQKKVIIDDFGF